jgi:hypothetical protein
MRPVAANGLILRHGRPARHSLVLRIRRIMVRKRLRGRKRRMIQRNGSGQRRSHAALGGEFEGLH